MSQTKFIKYQDYNPEVHVKFFNNKKEDLLFFKKYKEEKDKNKRLNAVLEKAQKDLSKIENENVTKNALEKAIEDSMKSLKGLSGDLENIAKSMNSYFGVQKKDAVESVDKLNKIYSDGFGNFKQLVEEVINKKNVIIDTNKVEKLLQKLDPAQLNKEFKEVGNPLGKIGELVGMIQLYQIGMNLIDNCFKNEKYSGGGDIKLEIVNVGEKSGTYADGTKAATLTTDNLLIIKQGNNILFSLNLSNKLNTEYKSDSKTTKRSIKIRTTNVNSFLKEHSDWSYSVYNAISYHYDTKTNERVDYLDYGSGIARQTIGMQILYDHIFGTKSNFEVGGQTFKDEVSLIAYGTKIVASDSVLKAALFTKAMNDKKKHIMVQIPERREWIKGPIETGKTTISSIWDAQKKINTFNLIYNQTLQVNGPFKFSR